MRIKDQIQLVRSALFRTEEELARLAIALGPDQCPCCVGAAYGGTIGKYDTLMRKRDRQEAWLKILTTKTSGGDMTIASLSYKDLLTRHRGLPK